MGNTCMQKNLKSKEPSGKYSTFPFINLLFPNKNGNYQNKNEQK